MNFYKYLAKLFAFLPRVHPLKALERLPTGDIGKRVLIVLLFAVSLSRYKRPHSNRRGTTLVAELFKGVLATEFENVGQPKTTFLCWWQGLMGSTVAELC